VSQPSVALIREQLEDREVANWLPVAAQLGLELVTTSTPSPYASSGLGLPTTVVKRRLGGFVSHRGVRRLVARLLDGTMDLDAMPRLGRVVDRFDVVVLNESHLSSSAQLAITRRDGGPRVITVCYENIPFRYEESARLSDRKDAVLAHTDHFVALTPQARASLIEEGVASERISMQPYGVDSEAFRPSRRSRAVRAAWGVRDDEVAVLFTGRLIREKGLVPLVRAVARTGTESVVLVIIGDGPESHRVHRAAASLDVRIVTSPWVASHEMPELVASADVFALPSLPTPYWEEQLGFSAIEAMSSGVPVITTGGGAIEFVVGSGGTCVTAYDVDALAKALSDLASSPARRSEIGAAGRARVEQVLNTSTVAARLAEIVMDVAR
jgi:glycosyltransferase involved in cell wall biosynthesis